MTSNMRYLEAEGVWLLFPPKGESFEIIVVGDPSGPSPEHLVLIEDAVQRISELRAKAVSYLEAFIDRAKFAPGCDWYFEGLDSGRQPGQTASQFSLYFSIEDDIYGEWSVSFQKVDALYYCPIAFARRQR